MYSIFVLKKFCWRMNWTTRSIYIPKFPCLFKSNVTFMFSYRQNVSVHFVAQELAFRTSEECLEFLEPFGLTFADVTRTNIDCKSSMSALQNFWYIFPWLWFWTVFSSRSFDCKVLFVVCRRCFCRFAVFISGIVCVFAAVFPCRLRTIDSIDFRRV